MTIHAKTCRRCEVVKPALEFNARHDAPDGLQSYCRECSNDTAHDADDRRHQREQVTADQRAAYAARKRARRRAINRLIDEHETEFRAMYDEELTR